MGYKKLIRSLRLISEKTCPVCKEKLKTEKEFGKFGEIDYIHIEERLLTDEEWRMIIGKKLTNMDLLINQPLEFCDICREWVPEIKKHNRKRHTRKDGDL